MLAKIKDAIFIICFSLFFGLLAYFGVNKVLNQKQTPVKAEFHEYLEQNNIVADSLLVVVDSLQVQVDSLHHVKDKTKLIIRLREVDTGAIIKQHFKTIGQTIEHRDKNLDFKLNFNLEQNKVKTPRLKYKILKPTIILSKVKQAHLYAGATFGGSFYEVDQFTPELIYFNGNHGFKVGYNFLNTNKNIQIGYYFKLK